MDSLSEEVAPGQSTSPRCPFFIQRSRTSSRRMGTTWNARSWWSTVGWATRRGASRPRDSQKLLRRRPKELAPRRPDWPFSSARDHRSRLHGGGLQPRTLRQANGRAVGGGDDECVHFATKDFNLVHRSPLPTAGGQLHGGHMERLLRLVVDYCPVGGDELGITSQTSGSWFTGAPTISL